MKNVLVVYYTQSGQLRQIAERIVTPFLNVPDVAITFHTIEPLRPFPFPWHKEAFFDVFPESFLQIPVPLKPVPEGVVAKKYDLILLFYQVWYLSPSIPVNSFLKSSEAKILFHNTPVVTINGSRNMWFMAQEKIKALLQQNNAQLKGNIALVDRVGNLISVITIAHWMFSGIKKKYLKIFPLPGVSERDIWESIKFGKIIFLSLCENSLDQLQLKLVAAGGVKVNSYLILVDKTANKIFNRWSSFISTKKKSRKNWLKVFYVYLLLAIWIISPLVFIGHKIGYIFKIKKTKKKSQYYQGV